MEPGALHGHAQGQLLGETGLVAGSQIPNGAGPLGQGVLGSGVFGNPAHESGKIQPRLGQIGIFSHRQGQEGEA